ncbi:exonuclease I [Actinobacillus equuli]|nr:exonuclease I [Actinobacillus equuli]
MAILRTLPPQELAHHGLQFADERVEALLFHYRARHYPETLSRAEQIRWQKYCHQQIDTKSVQFAEAIDNLFQIHHDNQEKVKLLENLTAYAAQIAEFQVVKHTANAQNEQLVSALNQVAEQGMDKAAKLEMLKALIK